jgi:glycosyltransferase involved in cell wall biosynthesis
MDGQRAIAIIIPGGIGTGRNNLGVPVLERIVQQIAVDHEVTVFQLFPANPGFAVHGFELVGAYSRFLPLKLLKFLFAFLRSHRRKKFQVVHGFWVLPGGLLAVVIGKLFGIKSIVSVLGGDAIGLPDIGYGQLLRSSYRALIFWTLKQAGEVIALTQYLVNNLRKVGFYRGDIHVIPWGIDNKIFSYREKPLEAPIRFLHIGNLHPVKDQVTLLRAFKQVSDRWECSLTVIGEGPMETEIGKQIEDLGLQGKVRLLKPMPYEQLPAYYHGAQVLLHTSLSEGQCEVVTEAMSAGVLVCGTRVGLMYDLPECCVSVDVGEHTALANAVLQVLHEPHTASVILHRARDWSAGHSLRWTVDSIKALYQAPST